MCVCVYIHMRERERERERETDRERGGEQGDDEEKNLHVSLIPEDKFLPYHSDPCARCPVCVSV